VTISVTAVDVTRPLPGDLKGAVGVGIIRMRRGSTVAYDSSGERRRQECLAA